MTRGGTRGAPAPVRRSPSRLRRFRSPVCFETVPASRAAGRQWL